MLTLLSTQSTNQSKISKQHDEMENTDLLLYFFPFLYEKASFNKCYLCVKKSKKGNTIVIYLNRIHFDIVYY